MPKAAKKPVPKDIKELCERLTPYFDELTAWLAKHHPDPMDVKPGGHFEPDPPPKPPDLGV